MHAAQRIPTAEPRLEEGDIAAVVDALRSGWISGAGAQLDEFERIWATYCNRAFGIAVSSGTTALELAVEALGLEPGDEVIMPTFTIISCALAVIRAGATPVLVDAESDTWCMDVDQVAARITARTRAIMAVHVYGRPCDMDDLTDLAEQYDLAIIEDAAEAHGAEYLSRRGHAPVWRRCGSFGRASVFSFYANKLVTTGEGGMIVTDDPDMAAGLRSQRNLAFQADRRFYHTALGHQYRLTNLQAALGVSQVARIDGLLAHKRWMGRAYTERLRDVPLLQLPREDEWIRHTYWMYGIVLHDDVALDAPGLAARLSANGVETRPFFLGMHEQPVFRQRGLFAGERYVVAERLARRGLYLPSGPGLTEFQLQHVCDTLREALS